jgi:hypothetical protein
VAVDDAAPRHAELTDAIRAISAEDDAPKLAAERARRPRTAPPLPVVREGTAVARAKRDAPAELRDLDAAFRAKMFAVLGKPEVLARMESLLTSSKDAVVIRALRAILPAVLVQRRDGDASHGPINLNFGIPRPPAIDAPPR